MNFALVGNVTIKPSTFAKVVEHEEWRKQWRMNEVVFKNQTLKIVVSPTHVKPIGYKWVYKIKGKASAEIDKFKA